MLSLQHSPNQIISDDILETGKSKCVVCIYYRIYINNTLMWTFLHIQVLTYMYILYIPWYISTCAQYTYLHIYNLTHTNKLAYLHIDIDV